jgi:hypothetical protein
MLLDSINTERRLFVLRKGNGYSCLGFDVARDRTRQYAQLLGELLPEPLPYATSEAFELYGEVERRFANSHVARTITLYDPNTPSDLAGLLEEARRNGMRIRLFYGDRHTGRDWNEENDIEGYLGRTMGPIHAPILLKSKSSCGGGIILSACIVKLLATATKRSLWQHPRYHTLPFSIADASSRTQTQTEWPIEVLCAGEVHARFKSRAEAARYVRRLTRL